MHELSKRFAKAITIEGEEGIDDVIS